LKTARRSSKAYRQDCSFVNTDKNLGNSTDQFPARLRWNRPLLFVLGWIFVAAGIVGLVLPFVPGTLFLILAAACFTRSSPRFESWLLDHPRYGPPVRAWRATGAIPRRAKMVAHMSLAASWLVLVVAGATTITQLTSLGVFLGVGIYIGTRPEA
jgi:uncharacterized membrane protein YbaN (DUF454 family)